VACACGCASTHSGGATHTARGVRYTLSYWSCKACGRVGGEQLFADGEFLGSGTPARMAYLEVDEKEPNLSVVMNDDASQVEPVSTSDSEQLALF